MFSRQLAKALGCPRVELDELFWGPNWTPKPQDAFQRLTAAAAAEACWVVEGNHGRVRDLLWPRATTIIWLNYGFPTIFFRALRRTLMRNITGETLWHGNRESLARSFFSRDSILVWVATTFWRRRREFNALRASGKYPRVSWVEFRRPSEATHYLRSVPVPANPSIQSGPAQAPAADF